MTLDTRQGSNYTVDAHPVSTEFQHLPSSKAQYTAMTPTMPPPMPLSPPVATTLYTDKQNATHYLNISTYLL